MKSKTKRKFKKPQVVKAGSIFQHPTIGCAEVTFEDIRNHEYKKLFGRWPAMVERYPCYDAAFSLACLLAEHGSQAIVRVFVGYKNLAECWEIRAVGVCEV